MNIPYFAYGSNMHLEQMAARCPGARLLDLVAKRGWRFIINDRGYVTAVEDASAETLGCLWELTDAHWETLDRYEGVSSGYYHRVNCQVNRLDSGEPLDAVAYRASSETPGVPTVKYADVVFGGARQIGLPEQYVATIEAWRNGPPQT